MPSKRKKGDKKSEKDKEERKQKVKVKTVVGFMVSFSSLQHDSDPKPVDQLQNAFFGKISTRGEWVNIDLQTIQTIIHQHILKKQQENRKLKNSELKLVKIHKQLITNFFCLHLGWQIPGSRVYLINFKCPTTAKKRSRATINTAALFTYCIVLITIKSSSAF